MIKRDTVETVYEYDKEGKLIKKTVTETHEEEDNTITHYPSWSYLNDTAPYCSDSISTARTTQVAKLNNCSDDKCAIGID